MEVYIHIIYKVRRVIYQWNTYPWCWSDHNIRLIHLEHTLIWSEHRKTKSTAHIYIDIFILILNIYIYIAQSVTITNNLLILL